MRNLLVLLLLLTLLSAGCALPLPGISPSVSGGHQQDLKTITTVELAGNNYRLVRTNVIGTDWGISFLGLIPIVSPDYTKAIAKLYKNGAVSEGRPLALVNVLQQHTAPFFLLFSIPRITFRADVIEYSAPPLATPPRPLPPATPENP